MLKITCVKTIQPISLIKSEFMSRMQPEWLDDPFVKEMVLDVDKSEIVSPYCINSPVLGQIAPSYLSGGVLALILMYKTDYIVNASKCGDNCSKWIQRISEKKDLTIYLEHVMGFDNDFTIEFLDSGVITHTRKEFIIECVHNLNEVNNVR